VPHGPITAELSSLVELFYDSPAELGLLNAVAASSLEQPYRELLAHPHHMTVTVERFHKSPVDVQVLDTSGAGDRYSRRILLTRQSDGRVVQFGIVRLNFEFLSPEVRREIESQSIPLGRVLIKHNVLREIELVAIWRVKPGPDLCKLLDCEPDQITYGRTAIIHCNGEPAVELLEIVTPVKS
jgi:chorismate-pyruvate lyase